MDGSNWFARAYLNNHRLNYYLYLIFGLLFFLPTSGLLLFGYRHGIFSDRFLALLLLGVLILSWIGIYVLRRIFETIRSLSSQVQENPVFPQAPGSATRTNELAWLVESFGLIERHFDQTVGQLEKKAADISTIKEVAEICSATFDPDEILQVALQRCLRLTSADMGSILMLEMPRRERFIIKATIGMGDRIKVGDPVDFETSIAKYAVINKSSLVVQDIERDPRFGRKNRPHYGSKGFICLPLKSMNTIIGVLTLASRQPNRVFNTESVEVLTSLLSTATFTYENLRLIKVNRQKARMMGSIAKIFNLISSSRREQDLIQSVLHELKALVDYRLAVLLLQENTSSPLLRVAEIIHEGPAGLTKDQTVALVPGSTLHQALGQNRPMIITDTSHFKHESDQAVLHAEDCQGYLLTQVSYEGRNQGVLVLAAKKAYLLRDRREIISWVVNGISHALDRQGLASAVARRDQELESVKQIGTVLASSTFDREKVTRFTLPMIQVTMNVTGGAIFILEKGRLVLKESFDLDEQKKAALMTSMAKGPGDGQRGFVDYISGRGETLRINSKEEAALYMHRPDELALFGSDRLLGVPIISQGKVIGAFLVFNKVEGPFSANDGDLLQSIAASVSIALENARLYASTAAMAAREREIRKVFQKFAPKEVLDKMLQTPTHGQNGVEDFKNLTLLNVDLRGFSTIAAQLGPRKTVSLLNRFFEVMGRIVFDHQGIVDKYLGDGFLALFGAPASLDDHADRAVRAALAMRTALPEVNRQLQRELKVAVEIGISVHTGNVVVGNLGFEMKMDYTVIGDAVNTVFRMQDLARSRRDCILLSDQTRQAITLPFRMQPLPEPIQLPGIPDPVRILELLGDGDRAAA